jgi:predicted Zn-dependent protease
MTGGVVWLWKQGALTPERAAAMTTGVRVPPAHEAIAASLESARKLMNEGEWNKAEAILRQAAAKYPEEQEIRIALAETLVASKDYAAAYQQYELALAIGPRDPRVEFAAGVVANTGGAPNKALHHFFAAQAHEPTNAAFALNLGLLQRKLNDVDGAKASLLRTVNLDPQNAFAWGTLADIALGENNVNVALQHISRARNLQPESRDWRLIEARAQKRKGDPERALLTLLPMDISQRREFQVVRLIAECYGMLGRHADAAAALADASLADPSNAELAYDAAVGFERAGERTKAIEFAQRGKILGSQPAARFLERISR